MTRRFFAGMLASATAATTAATASVKSAFGVAPFKENVSLDVSNKSAVRQAFWIKLAHEGPVRFKLGVDGEEALACGIIAPLPGSGYHNYGILSVKGLKASTPLKLTLSSKIAFKVLGTQSVYNNPYEVCSHGDYSFIMDGGRSVT